MALKVGELFASFNVDSSGATGAISSIMSSCDALGTKFQATGAAMTAAITLPLAKLAKSMFQKGTDFEAQMSKVFAVSGLTDATEEGASAMTALTEKARELGSTTVWTATEAGEALVYMGMAGWETEAMLAGLTPIMNLASAAGADLGTTSDIVTDAMTAFGLTLTKARKESGDLAEYIDGIDAAMESGDWSAFAADLGEGSDAMSVFNDYVQHFTDVLSAAAVNSNTNVTMLGESFKYIAPVAGALGYSIDDAAVALGLMANNGIKASMAGTSLRNIITRMAKPTDEIAAAMEAMGLSMYNADGTTKSLADQMSDWRAAAAAHKDEAAAMAKAVKELDDQLAAGSITSEEYDAGIAAATEGAGDFLKNVTALAGLRGMSGLLAIMNTSDEEFAKLTEAINGADGTTSKMAETMLDNVQGSITLMNSAFEGLSTTLFDNVKEPIRQIIDTITELLQKFQGLDTETQNLILKIGGIAAAAGPALALAGTALKILPTLTSIVGALASPLGIALGALGLIFAAGKDEDDHIGEWLEGLQEKIDSIDWDAISEKLSGFFGDLADTMTTGLSKVAGWGESLLNTISDKLKEIDWDKATIDFTGFVAALLKGIGNALEHIGAAAPAILSGAVNLAEGILSAINAGLTSGNINDGILSLVQSIGNALRSIINGSGTNIITAATDLGGAIIDTLINAIVQVGDLGTRLVQTISTFLADIDWGKLTVDISGFASMLLNGITNALKAAANGAASIVGAISDLLGNIQWGEVEIDLSVMGESIISGIVAALKSVVNAGTTIMDAIVGLLKNINWAGMASTLASLAEDLIRNLLSGAANLTVDASGLIAAIGKGIGAAASSIGSFLGNLAGSIVSSLINLIFDPKTYGDILKIGFYLGKGILTGLWNALEGLATGVWNAISGAFKSLFGLSDADMEEVYGEFTELYKNTNKETAEFVQEQAKSADTASAEGLSNLFEAYELALKHGGSDAEGAFDDYAEILTGEQRTLYELLSGKEMGIFGQYKRAANEDELGLILAGLTYAGKDVSAYLESAGEDVQQAYENFMDSSVYSPEEIFGYIKDDFYVDLAKMTSEGVETVAESLEGSAETISEATDLVIEADASLKEALEALGVDPNGDFSNGFASALENTGVTLQNAVQVLGADVVKAAAENMSTADGYSIGYNMVQGVIDGINAQAGAAAEAARAMAEAVLAAERDAMGIASPSKETMKDAGYFLQGFEKGLSSSLPGLTATVKGAAGGLLDAFALPNVGHAFRGLASEFADATTRTGSRGYWNGAESGMSTTNYNYSEPVNINTVNVRDNSDIDALAAEIAAAQRRSRHGYGS